MSFSEHHESTDARLVAPQLSKSGLYIDLQTKPQSFEQLIEEQIITRRRLEEYGFILIDNYISAPEKKNGEVLLKDDTTIQFIHRDLPPPQTEGMHMVYLRYPEQQKRRGAYTVLGDAGSVLKHLSSFIVKDSSPLPAAMHELREKILNIDIDALSPRDMYTDQRTWSENVFIDIAQNVRGSGFSRIHELYDALQPALYKHIWQPNQLLIWDDTSMVHGRLPFRQQQSDSDGGYLFRKKMFWAKESSQLVLLD